MKRYPSDYYQIQLSLGKKWPGRNHFNVPLEKMKVGLCPHELFPSRWKLRCLLSLLEEGLLASLSQDVATLAGPSKLFSGKWSKQIERFWNTYLREMRPDFHLTSLIYIFLCYIPNWSQTCVLCTDCRKIHPEIPMLPTWHQQSLLLFAWTQTPTVGLTNNCSILIQMMYLRMIVFLDHFPGVLVVLETTSPIDVERC